MINWWIIDEAITVIAVNGIRGLRGAATKARPRPFEITKPTACLNPRKMFHSRANATGPLASDLALHIPREELASFTT
jgi:hypothetical protein